MIRSRGLGLRRLYGQRNDAAEEHSRGHLGRVQLLRVDARTLSLARLVADPYVAGEIIARLLTLVRNTADSSLFGTQQSRVLTLSVGLADLIRLAENAAATLTGIPTASSRASTSTQAGSALSGLPPAAFLVLALLAVAMAAFAVFILAKRRQGADEPATVA